MATIFMAVGMLLLPISITLAMAEPSSAANRCGGVDTAIISCDQGGNGGTEDTGLWGLLIIAINILTAGIGIAAIAGIVYGIVLYTTSSGDPAGVKKAMEVIRNVVIGIAAYALMFSFLQWIIPGGVFNTSSSSSTSTPATGGSTGTGASTGGTGGTGGTGSPTGGSGSNTNQGGR